MGGNNYACYVSSRGSLLFSVSVSSRGRRALSSSNMDLFAKTSSTCKGGMPMRVIGWRPAHLLLSAPSAGDMPRERASSIAAKRLCGGVNKESTTHRSRLARLGIYRGISELSCEGRKAARSRGDLAALLSNRRTERRAGGSPLRTDHNLERCRAAVSGPVSRGVGGEGLAIAAALRLGGQEHGGESLSFPRTTLSASSSKGMSSGIATV
jgi:hypothetical protein